MIHESKAVQIHVHHSNRRCLYVPRVPGSVKNPHNNLLKKPTDLDLHCLQRHGISGFSRTRVNWMILPFLPCYILSLEIVLAILAQLFKANDVVS